MYETWCKYFKAYIVSLKKYLLQWEQGNAEVSQCGGRAGKVSQEIPTKYYHRRQPRSYLVKFLDYPGAGGGGVGSYLTCVTCMGAGS